MKIRTTARTLSAWGRVFVFISYVSLSVIILGSTSVHADEISLESLVRSSDNVIDCSLLLVTHEIAGNTPYTCYECRVEEVFLGNLNSFQVKNGQQSFRRCAIGGKRADGTRVGVTHQPNLQAGKRYILFLNDRGDPLSITNGWREGVLLLKAGRIYDYYGKPLSLESAASTSESASHVELFRSKLNELVTRSTQKPILNSRGIRHEQP